MHQKIHLVQLEWYCSKLRQLFTIFQASDRRADAIEVDVGMTRDGVPILLHDDYVDRTTDGHGRILDFDYAQARKLNAAANHPHKSALVNIYNSSIHITHIKFNS